MVKKLKKPRFNVGDVINSRIIKEIRTDFNSVGEEMFYYGYKYAHEDEDFPPMWCNEKTLLRKWYNQ
jgi:hypothetical protein